MFEGRIQREEGRPVTLGELLLGLKAASRISQEESLRMKIAEERRKLWRLLGPDSAVPVC